MKLADGEYTLSFEAEGYPNTGMQRPVTVTGPKETVVRTVKLSKGLAYALIQGRVYNGDGVSLPGVTIVCERLDGAGKKEKQQKESNSGGSFAFRLPGEPGHYRVTATMKGYKPDSKELDVDRGEAHSVALK